MPAMMSTEQLQEALRKFKELQGQSEDPFQETDDQMSPMDSSESLGQEEQFQLSPDITQDNTMDHVLQGLRPPAQTQQRMPASQEQENPLRAAVQKPNFVSTLERLKQAQQGRNRNQSGADMDRAAAYISEGISGVENKALKSRADSRDKRAGQPIEDFGQEVDINKKDPGSETSKAYREFVVQNIPGLEGKIPESMSAADLEKAIPWLKSLYAKTQTNKFQKMGVGANGNFIGFDPSTGKPFDTGMAAQQPMMQVRDNLTGEVKLVRRNDLLGGGASGSNVISSFGTPQQDVTTAKSNEELYQSLNVKQRDGLKHNQDEFLKDTKDDRDAINAARGIGELLRAGDNELDGDVLRAVQTQFARANGERGAMTENDVTGFGGRADVMSRLDRMWTMGTSGKLPPEDREFLARLAKVMEKRANDYINNQSKVYQNNFAQMVPNLGPENSKRLLNVESTMTSGNKTQNPNGEIRRKTKDGRTAIFDSNKKFLRYEQ